ncbi:peptide-N-glycosidase F-related protein [Pedobacter punctiformis]|uniref:Peptide-N-glycosidase F-related protein n=1 Tax=Pedobacter punctiformis TaxID=3004097 RepID=A0ABT4LB91_9SPHI|nr:peptide-N-glycosidase F-related protein [Pedobacter sp. HCMS5-2]MCZ4245197.1 peptide-N-glycosidase F-related protein [Pedobacter sp. HCMS5-2]
MITFKKHTFLFAFAFFCSVCCFAQKNETTINVLNAVHFYDGYAKPVNEPVQQGLIRLSNTKYIRKLTDAERGKIGHKLNVKLVVTAGCDNYDRIGRVTLYKTPKNKSFDDAEAEEYELLRIMTPFMYKTRKPDQIPYTAQADQMAGLFKDKSSDIWVLTEIFGTTGAGQKEVIGCDGSLLTFTVSVDFISDKSKNTNNAQIAPLLSYYALDGKDTTAGYNAKEVEFTLTKNAKSAVFYLISSGHGAGENGEEYNWRTHVLYLDGKEYTRLDMNQNCSPYEIYNTQPNGIYFGNIAKERRSWCPGAPVPVRVVNLGSLNAGKHKLKITVPEASLLKTESNYLLSCYIVAQ